VKLGRDCNRAGTEKFLSAYEVALTGLVDTLAGERGVCGVGARFKRCAIFAWEGGVLRGETGQILWDIYLDNLGVSPITGTAGLSAGHPDVKQERISDAPPGFLSNI
jgi:hypothetical protein